MFYINEHWTKEELRAKREMRALLDTIKREDRYIGGVIFWIHDGEELRTMYIVDCTPCKLTQVGTFELTVCLTDLEQFEPTYDGPDVLHAVLTGYKLPLPGGVAQIVKESKPEIYHLTNVFWSLDTSWTFLKYIETADMPFRDFGKEEFYVMLQQATDITLMFDDFCSGILLEKDLEDLMRKNKTWDDVWYVLVDLRTFWRDSEICPRLIN